MGLVYLLWMVLGMLMGSSSAGVKLDLHLALSQGSTLPKQEGDYLQDSFRRNVLIPAFAELNLEIENRTRSTDSNLDDPRNSKYSDVFPSRNLVVHNAEYKPQE